MTRRDWLRAWRPTPRWAEDEAGFTLVELVASLTVLAVGIVGVIGVMNGSFRVAAVTSARSKAVAVATQEIEALRAQEYDLIDPADPLDPAEEYDVVVDGRSYHVTRSILWTDEATAPPTTQGQTAVAPT